MYFTYLAASVLAVIFAYSLEYAVSKSGKNAGYSRTFWSLQFNPIGFGFRSLHKKIEQIPNITVPLMYVALVSIIFNLTVLFLIAEKLRIN